MSNSTLHPLSRILPTKPYGPMRSPARALGWFSIGLGLAELAMPRSLARMAGAPNAPTLTRVFGLREVGTGIGILTSKDPSPWLWGRVVGDALDVATVGAGLVTRGRPLRTLTSLAMLLGIAYVDMKVAEQAAPARKLANRSSRDYRGRSGFPRPAAEMRGIALRPSTPMGRPQVPAAPMTGSPVQPLVPAGEPTSSMLP